MIPRRKLTGTSEVRILLHDIRSIHNVGSIFRIAGCLGIGQIILSGFSPTPQDRFGKFRSDFAKVSLGSEKYVAWEYVQNPSDYIAQFKKEHPHGEVLAVEQHAQSVDYKKHVPKYPTLVIMGSEVEGISSDILACADSILEIPQSGKKESLNVSVAAGIVLFRLFDR